MKAELLDASLPVSSLGEGPCWDSVGQKIYWLDILGKTIHRFDPATREHASCKTPSCPTGLQYPTLIPLLLIALTKPRVEVVLPMCWLVAAT